MSDPEAIGCYSCGCKGNCSCGHEPLDPKRLCTLDMAEICPCCRVKQLEQAAKKATKRYPYTELQAEWQKAGLR